MWDFPESPDLARLAVEIYERGGVVSAVCHGPAGLVDLRLSDGSYLIDGKRVASFTNEEEHSLGLVDVMPFLLEDRLKERGAHHAKAANYVCHTESDNRVITGQNPASAAPVAHLVVAELRRRETVVQGLVQVAGVIDQAEADLIVEEGADWLGFALRLPAKNEDLSEAEAAAIVKAIQPEHKGVIITYLTEAEEIKAFCAEMGVGAIQLHGDVLPAELRKLRKIAPELFLLKSLVVKTDNLDELATIVAESAEWVDMFITDTFNPATGAKGATGLVHDWDVSAELVRISPKPLMLAGGLNPENVAAAIEKVRPAAVDAHTGLEDATGRKDRQKVRTFVAESRRAFARIAAEAEQGRAR
jgi:phosphoribosylanthranilate isomerase